MSVPNDIQKKAKKLADGETAKCIAHFEKGITKCGDLSKGMSLLMADLLTERVSTSVANAVCNSAGKMLKAVEMQQRYGKTGSGGGKELGLLE
jgi:hypothetical protein